MKTYHSPSIVSIHILPLSLRGIHREKKGSSPSRREDSNKIEGEGIKAFPPSLPRFECMREDCLKNRQRVWGKQCILCIPGTRFSGLQTDSVMIHMHFSPSIDSLGLRGLMFFHTLMTGYS